MADISAVCLATANPGPSSRAKRGDPGPRDKRLPGGPGSPRRCAPRDDGVKPGKTLQPSCCRRDFIRASRCSATQRENAQMKSNWIGGVAAAALLVAGAASAQTMGNGPATTSTPGNPNATTSSPDTPGNTGTVPIGNGSMGTGSTAAGTTTAPMPGTADNGAVNTTSQNQSQPARGANSFTQGEARSRLQARGYQNASNLHEDANGVWRGQATHEGQQVSVWLDYKGNVGQGGPGQVTGQQANQYLLTQQRQQEPNMATRTIARLYATYNDAAAVVDDLQSSGIPQTDISIVRQGAHTVDTTTATGESGAGVGATVGTLLGGGAGLLAGLGTIAIPGVGPIVAAGWLIAMLTGAGVGAAAGGILGALTGA